MTPDQIAAIRERLETAAPSILGYLTDVDITNVLAALSAETQRADTAEGQRDMWQDAYEGTDHAHEQRAWQHERETTVARIAAADASLTALRDALDDICQHYGLAQQHLAEIDKILSASARAQTDAAHRERSRRCSTLSA